jgi:hypothetical protein
LLEPLLHLLAERVHAIDPGLHDVAHDRFLRRRERRVERQPLVAHLLARGLRVRLRGVGRCGDRCEVGLGLGELGLQRGVHRAHRGARVLAGGFAVRRCRVPHRLLLRVEVELRLDLCEDVLHLEAAAAVMAVAARLRERRLRA